MKKNYLLTFLSFLFFFTACQSTKADLNNKVTSPILPKAPAQKIQDEKTSKSQLNLLFAGDIMAHSVNYNVRNYNKIWESISETVLSADLAFGNIESPVDTTKEASSYPQFNMTKKYLQAAIDSGFDVFSLCNNHTNDWFLEGIKETIKTTNELTEDELKEGHRIYFSGVKNKPEDEYTWNYIERNGWKIIFLPITELLNRNDAASYINFVKPKEADRTKLKNFIKKLNNEYPNDLFILSVHTAEPEYVRAVTQEQEDFYKDLLDCGVDVLWANHAHIIKDRKYIFNVENNTQKVIMYANGNTISGQRTKPDFDAKTPAAERDNTGDGLMVQITFTKDTKGKKAHITKAENIFITTYINSAWEFVIKPMNQAFIDYLYEVKRDDWANYIEKRMKINNTYTKDLLEWQ